MHKSFRKWGYAVSNTLSILASCESAAEQTFPEGVAAPLVRDTALYLAHTGGGESIRAIASACGGHPSTVLRAVRRVEARRDDPLFDRLIGDAEAVAVGTASRPASASNVAAEPSPAIAIPPDGGEGACLATAPVRATDSWEGVAPGLPSPVGLSDDAVRRAAKSVLRRLSEPGAFLMIAPGAEKGGVFCPANGHRKPIALVAVDIAAEFVRREWIAMISQGQASARYRIAEPGKSALKRFLSEDLAARSPAGFAEAQSPFQIQHGEEGVRGLPDPETGRRREIRVNLAESPIGWLARRKGADGEPFLTPDEVEAGERLRDDFERAQMGPSVTQDWHRFLTPVDAGPATGRIPCSGPSGARQNVIDALSGLGSGLADVALRVCCFLEGLESCERRMGWSARSGKVVLKIALQRLNAHYTEVDARR